MAATIGTSAMPSPHQRDRPDESKRVLDCQTPTQKDDREAAQLQKDDGSRLHDFT